MKICTKCKIEKSVDCYAKNSQQTSGLSPACKECNNKLNQLRRADVLGRNALDPPPLDMECLTCNRTFLVESFPNDKGCRWGKRPLCQECSAKRKRDQYLEKRLEQESTHPVPKGCEICGTNFDLEAKKGVKGKERPHWDHIHGTEIFRGWLCHNCNSALGQFGENIKIVENALRYILERGAKPSRSLIS